MKKYWKIIIGVILIAGGIGLATADLYSGTIDILVGVLLIVWWKSNRRKAASKYPKPAVQLHSHVRQINQSPTEKEETGIQLNRTSSPSAVTTHEFSIEISGFEKDEETPQNLDFYRDKLNTKKAITTFDTYVVLDCETTGLSSKTDEIIEIALIKYIKGELVDTFSSLIKPSCQISPTITKITGITNADVENAPTIQAIIPQVWNFIDGFVLVGHNIPFDIGFLKKQFVVNGYEGRFNYIDTLQLARSAFPEFPNHKLSTCIDRLSLSDGQTHRAMDDVICTQRLLEKCLPILLEQKERELAERRARKASVAERTT